MANYNKGNNTKNVILDVSKRLFYNQGYSNTTTRQIAEEAEVNLGLIKYHFDSKADIACSIYLGIRDYYDEEFRNQGYKDTELYLISSISELILCFTNLNFRYFYRDIYKENKLENTLKSHISKYLDNQTTNASSYKILAASCLSKIKPALVDQYIEAGENHFSNETYIRFYLQQQTHFNTIENSDYLCDFAMQEIDKYDIHLEENFTPVIKKLR